VSTQDGGLHPKERREEQEGFIAPALPAADPVHARRTWSIHPRRDHRKTEWPPNLAGFSRSWDAASWAGRRGRENIGFGPPAPGARQVARGSEGWQWSGDTIVDKASPNNQPLSGVNDQGRPNALGALRQAGGRDFVGGARGISWCAHSRAAGAPRSASPPCWATPSSRTTW